MRSDRLQEIRRLARRTEAPARPLRHAVSDLLFLVDELRAAAGRKIELEPPPPKTKEPSGPCEVCGWHGWRERSTRPGYYACNSCIRDAIERSEKKGDPVE